VCSHVLAVALSQLPTFNGPKVRYPTRIILRPLPLFVPTLHNTDIITPWTIYRSIKLPESTGKAR